MIVQPLLMPDKKIEQILEGWGDRTLTLLLLIVGGFAIWVALRKDHLVLKAILLAWLVLP